MILKATSEYRVFILVSLLNHDNFSDEYFITNKCHHGAPWSGGPGAIAPVAPLLIRLCFYLRLNAPCGSGDNEI